MSKTKLNVNEPSSFVAAFDTLSRAVAILDTVQQDRFPISPSSQSVDVANYMRCISGAFYNIAGSLYQANRYGNAVPFFVESCELGAKALRLPRPVQDPPNETREKEWLLLEEQLFRRWEILGVCYSKNGDRKVYFISFLSTSFPRKLSLSFVFLVFRTHIMPSSSPFTVSHSIPQGWLHNVTNFRPNPALTRPPVQPSSSSSLSSTAYLTWGLAISCFLRKRYHSSQRSTVHQPHRPPMEPTQPSWNQM